MITMSFKTVPQLLIILLLYITPLHAGSTVYKGSFRNTAITDKCDKESGTEQMILILNRLPDGTITGSYYNSDFTAGTLRQTADSTFEMITPLTEIQNLKPSLLSITDKGGRSGVEISIKIMEKPEIIALHCWNSQPPFILKPLKDDPEYHLVQAKERYAVELLIEKGAYQLEQKDFTHALDTGRKAMAAAERLYGPTSEEGAKAMILVVLPLYKMDRFDEALKLIKPFIWNFPDYPELKEIERLIRQEKKEYERLFQHQQADPDIDPDRPQA